MYSTTKEAKEKEKGEWGRKTSGKFHSIGKKK